MQKKDIFIYQIFHDENGKKAIEPGYIPIDNTQDERADWYELWIIRNYLKKIKLEDNNWYGFFSWKFKMKTGLSYKDVLDFLTKNKNNYEVVLFPHCLDQIAYFQNPFFQGDFFQPGLLDLSQDLFDELKIKIDLKNTICHSLNSVFSYQFVAKPLFWNKWLKLADQFFDFCENSKSKLSKKLNKITIYGTRNVPMKAYIQERLATTILIIDKFKVFSFNNNKLVPIYNKLFNENTYTSGILQSLDNLKLKYVSSNDEKYLNKYREIKKSVPFNFSVKKRAILKNLSGLIREYFSKN